MHTHKHTTSMHVLNQIQTLLAAPQGSLSLTGAIPRLDTRFLRTEFDSIEPFLLFKLNSFFSIQALCSKWQIHTLKQNFSIYIYALN